MPQDNDNERTAPLSPMQAGALQYFVQRAYDAGGPFQWVREAYLNSVEASATRVWFSLEWQGVELHRIYRRMIVDNGFGMSPEQIAWFLNVFGGGGKPIGGLTENYGIGFKASTLPWNHEGIVVISYQHGVGSMIWLKRGEDGEYGLKQVWSAEDNTYLSVMAPYLEDEVDSPELLRGIDWETVAPEEIRKPVGQPGEPGYRPTGPNAQGTVMVLLGNSLDQHTILGDPDRDNPATKAMALYLNTRLWEIDEGVSLTVEELRHSEQDLWPRSRDDKAATIDAVYARRAEGHDEGASPNPRVINGARHFIDKVEFFALARQGTGHAGPHGTVVVPDGTRVHWFLWEGDRPAIHDYGVQNGYVGALYRNELYDLATTRQAAAARWNAFGIIEQAVRDHLWLIVEPPVAHEDNPHAFGVFPDSSRNSLRTLGGPYKAASPLPWADWGDAFWKRLPPEIAAALDAARAVEPEDKDQQKKLQDRFGERWSMIWQELKRRLTNNATNANGTTEPTEPRQRLPIEHTHEVAQQPTRPHGPRRVIHKLGIGNGAHDANGHPSVGEDGQTKPLPPKWIWMSAKDGGFGEGILAEYVPSRNQVKLNADHFMILDVIAYWQGRYRDNASVHARVVKGVHDVYGQEIASRIVHFLAIKERLGSEFSGLDLTDSKWLTYSLLGLYVEDHLIGSSLGGVLGVSRGRRPS